MSEPPPVIATAPNASRVARPSPVVDTGQVYVNARPWADVWIDGRLVGTTPLSAVSVPTGTHEIIWRHPEFGERRQTVVVSADVPTRLGVDLRP